MNELLNKSTDSFVIARDTLKKIRNNFTLENGITNSDLATLLKKSIKIIKDNVGELTSKETQIYRNITDLGCKRHMGIFNKFNIIPKFCFSCFKIQVEPKNVLELCKLYLIFDRLKLPTNNTRKCMIELRPKVSGTYKGLIYCSSIEEANEILKLITPVINKLITGKIKIKRGCSEYSDVFPDYGVTDKEDKKYMKYKDEWDEKEKIFDSTSNKRAANNNFTSHAGLTIHEVMIMNNWLNYAKEINDLTYKDISEDIIYSDYISKITVGQLNARIF
jgi:hypothetical protein